jgi:hypothetical protein
VVNQQPSRSGEGEPARAEWTRTRAWHIGIDVGKRADYTAVCIARVVERPSLFDGKGEIAYIAETLERIPLGINYVSQAELVYPLLAGVRELSIQERGGSANGASGINFDETGPGGWLATLPRIRVLADETGVGDAFCDILQRLMRLDRRTETIPLIRVRFVGGAQYRRDYSDGMLRGIVGKEFLARKLVTMVKARRVTLPAELAGRADVEDELRAYEARMREEDGHTTYGAQEPGTHDDLLTAVALAVLETGDEHGVSYGRIVF